MQTPLQQLLAAKSPIILDGAMGTELQRRGIDTGLPLWSANALMVHPEVVLQIHKDYIDAGADIITTNTFRTTRRTFRRANLPDRSAQMVKKAIRLAHEARGSSPDRRILIAGSIAPLEDCYRPDLVPPDPELLAEHKESAERLADAQVDFLLLETMNTIREAYAACAAATATGKEVIVSFICNPKGNLYSGERLGDALNILADLSPTGYSLNCASPRHMKLPINILKAHTSSPFAVYANVGLPENERQGWEFTRDIPAEDYAAFGREWFLEGASIIGGCCGTTPEYIRVLKQTFFSDQQPSTKR